MDNMLKMQARVINKHMQINGKGRIVLKFPFNIFWVEVSTDFYNSLQIGSIITMTLTAGEMK